MPTPPAPQCATSCTQVTPAERLAAMPQPIDDGYPIVVRLAGRPVLVVGGGRVALRKVQGLTAAGAAVTVIAPEVVDELRAIDGVRVVERAYERDDVAGHVLVIAATDDPAVQQQVFDEGERHGILVNSADDPDRCSFILPAVERRGPVIVAVSTQGRSPALAGHLRDLLASALPEDLEALVDAARRRRDEIHAAGGSTERVTWPNPFATESDAYPPGCKAD